MGGFFNNLVICSTNQVMEVWTLWHPTYWLLGCIKAIATLICACTTLALVPLMTPGLTLVSSSAQLKARNKALLKTCDQLQIEIGRRTAELTSVSALLSEEIAARQQAEAKFRQMFECNIMLGLLFWDTDGNVIDANDAFLKMLGYTKAELISGAVRWKDLTPSEYSDLDDKAIAQLIATGFAPPFEKECICKDGTRLPIMVGGALLEGSQNIGVCFVLDISSRIALEKELILRENRLNAFFNCAPVGLKIVDDQMRFVQINEPLALMHGISMQDHIGRSVSEVLPKLAPILEPLYQQVLIDSQPTFNKEVSGETLGQPGVMRDWVVSCFPIPDKDGCSLSVGVVIVEMTECKQAELALRALTQQQQDKAQQLEQTLMQLRRTQAQLVQNEKMASLGQLVAGVAHEINNPTSFISCNIAPAQEYATDLLHLLQLYQHHYPEPVAEITAQIEHIDLEFIATDFLKLLASMQEGANRITQIVRSLRNFSRLDEGEGKQVDIHEGIDNTLLILQHQLKPQSGRAEIQIIKEYAQLPKVDCYPSQLNQVFMNILSNAIDALENQPAPRIITIRTILLENSSVAIQIQDNGPGMSIEVKNRLFDPFFTTKPVGQGTGLGLSISYQIVVEKHGGILKCFSQPGQGAEFWIEIPV